MPLVAGIDLGGTAINYTFLDQAGNFLLDTLCEHPSRATEGPSACLNQIADGLAIAAKQVEIDLADIAAIGLDTPGPASATGVLSRRGSTNFVHPHWAGLDLRAALSLRLDRPVIYLNDGNAAALWGHFRTCGATRATSVTAVIGTGLGGGVVVDGAVVHGRNGFAGELGHVVLPYQQILQSDTVQPMCNCGRIGDLESLCSLTAIERTLLPHFLRGFPDHPIAGLQDIRGAARLVRGLAERGDALCRAVFSAQARALGFFFDIMINVFDPDVLLVGGGALEAGSEFQDWFCEEIRFSMPSQREEQANIPITVMPNGDTASARGAAIEALKFVRQAELSAR